MPLDHSHELRIRESVVHATRFLERRVPADTLKRIRDLLCMQVEITPHLKALGGFDDGGASPSAAP